MKFNLIWYKKRVIFTRLVKVLIVTPTEFFSAEIYCNQNGMKTKEFALKVNLPRQSLTDLIKKWTETGSNIAKKKLWKVSKVFKINGLYSFSNSPKNS